MSTQSEQELPFSPDFAARVFCEADTRRRRRRLAALGAIATAGVSAAMAIFMFVQPTRHITPTVSIATAQPLRMDSSVEAPTDPMQFLFPDARPVAQFADDYADMAYGRERRLGDMLFANDAETGSGDL